MVSEQILKKQIKKIIKNEEWEKLRNIDVSPIKDFSRMFENSNLPDTDYLINWDVSNGINFSKMFNRCSSIRSLNGLKYWNVSKGKDFSYMFSCCSFLKSAKELINWDIQNEIPYSGCFFFCGFMNSDKENDAGKKCLRNVVEMLS